MTHHGYTLELDHLGRLYWEKGDIRIRIHMESSDFWEISGMDAKENYKIQLEGFLTEKEIHDHAFNNKFKEWMSQ
jgi:hypothetical protein